MNEQELVDVILKYLESLSAYGEYTLVQDKYHGVNLIQLDNRVVCFGETLEDLRKAVHYYRFDFVTGLVDKYNKVIRGYIQEADE